MENHINMEDLDRKMVLMGFREILTGTPMLRDAVQLWRPGMSITKDLYPAIAEKYHSTPSRVERAMRHSIESAFSRGDTNTGNLIFGYSISAAKGAPTNGEFIGRMARVCRNGDY